GCPTARRVRRARSPGFPDVGRRGDGARVGILGAWTCRSSAPAGSAPRSGFGSGRPATASWQSREGRRPPSGRRFLPGVPVVEPADAARGAEVVLIATPDDRIGEACDRIVSAWPSGEGRFVAHVSGATVLSIHPLQSFPDVERALARLEGSGMAVTALSEDGFALGERLARDVGGRPFRLADQDRPLYHAAAVFASNYLVAVLSVAEDLFGRLGLERELFLPLARASLDNTAATGAALALTGPGGRGDGGAEPSRAGSCGSEMRSPVHGARGRRDRARRALGPAHAGGPPSG